MAFSPKAGNEYPAPPWWYCTTELGSASHQPQQNDSTIESEIQTIFIYSSLHSAANPLYEMPFDSFDLFPLLPIEIRLLIWIMTFPQGRRFEPWKWEYPAPPGCMRLYAKPPPQSGPGFNFANTDPVALWVNQESREEIFKHYTAREPLHRKRLGCMYNVRWPAHIDFRGTQYHSVGKRLVFLLGPVISSPGPRWITLLTWS